jgi:hypothetical protein
MLRRTGLSQLDNLHQEQDENDEQDKADAAAAVVAEARSHAITAKAEHQNQNEQEDKHLYFSPFGEVSPMEGVMLILLQAQSKNLLVFICARGGLSLTTTLPPSPRLVFCV